MGKVLILLNLAGLVLNLLVFIVVVSYVESAETGAAKSAQTAEPPASRSDMDRALNEQTAKLNASIQNFSSKFLTLTRDLKNVSDGLARIRKQLDLLVPENGEPVGEVTEPEPIDDGGAGSPVEAEEEVPADEGASSS